MKASLSLLSGLLGPLVFAGCVGGLVVNDGNGDSPGSPNGTTDGAPGPEGTTGPGGSEPPPIEEQPKLACDEGLPQASPSLLRRLAPREYLNSVSDLLAMDFVAPLDDTETVYTTELAVRQFDEATRLLETQVLDAPSVAPCDILGPTDRSCVESFIASFGERAFRRTVSEEEKTALLSAYDEARTELDHAAASLALLRIMLQSPQFLYRVEIGEEDPSLPPGMRKLTGYERATRLSYFFLGTTPDQELLDAARSGELDDAAGVRAEANRLLTSTTVREPFREVVSEWLQLDGATVLPSLEDTPKDVAAVGQELTQGLRSAMRNDVLTFAERVTFDEQGTFEALLTDTHAFVTPELADLYGASGEGWIDVGAERPGILTRAAWLTLTGSQKHQSPIRRGAFLIREFLCQPLSDPPATVDNTPVDPSTDSTADAVTIRQITEERTTGDQCQGCHKRINGLGFAFEHFDTLGRWHDTEQGAPVDAATSITGTDVDGPVSGAADFMNQMANSAVAKSCFGERFFRSALGRTLGELDDCSRETVMQKFSETGNIQELLLDIASSDAFLYMNGAAPAAQEEGQ